MLPLLHTCDDDKMASEFLVVEFHLNFNISKLIFLFFFKYVGEELYFIQTAILF